MARRPMTLQFDLFSNLANSRTAQVPQWRTLPRPTRQVLMPLIVRLLLDHAGSDPAAAPREAGDEL